MIDSVSKSDKNYFPQKFPEEGKYKIEKIKSFITDELERSSDGDSEQETFDKKY